MSAKKVASSGWPVRAVDPPQLTTKRWSIAAIPAFILLIAAILQLISFNDFKEVLSSHGLPGPAAWAVAIIFAELWGAAGFFKWRLSVGFRAVAYTMAVLVAMFWFVHNLQLLATGAAEHLDNSGFFGRFLAQQPGWWTVAEVTVLLFWVLYEVGHLRDNQN
jgi:phosphatidylserine synthase